MKIDGEWLIDAEARAFWDRFSVYMEAHRGDLAGFAKREGFASVHPSTEAGGAVLLVSRTEPQRPYAPVREKSERPFSRSNGSGGGSRLDRSRRLRSPKKPSKSRA